jgi:hypothetical protein
MELLVMTDALKRASAARVVLSQRVVLHTMVSRNYGLAHPKETQTFSEKEGCI